LTFGTEGYRFDSCRVQYLSDSRVIAANRLVSIGLLNRALALLTGANCRGYDAFWRIAVLQCCPTSAGAGLRSAVDFPSAAATSKSLAMVVAGTAIKGIKNAPKKPARIKTTLKTTPRDRIGGDGGI
jgi:hypothetical protein